jgi:protein-tyrosine phosphatase
MKRKLCAFAKHPSQTIISNENVLFVCYGNICRSAFADCYRQKLTNGEHTKSAGYFPKEGRLMNLGIKMIAEHMNIDCAEFHSHVLTEEMLQWGDYVFCFDEKNYYYLKRHFRKYMKKVYLLGAYDMEQEGTPIIEDPYGYNDENKMAVISRIANIIQNYLC